MNLEIKNKIVLIFCLLNRVKNITKKFKNNNNIIKMNNNIINNDKKTVFFGPFIGELGWELSYWQGWVKKMCRERYDSYRKITASYPGKEPFYPDVDEFWQLPEDFLKLRVCARAYASDFWKGNIPKGDNADSFDKNISQHADNLLKYFRNKLPSDTIFYTPYKLNRYMLDNKKHFLGSIFMKGFNDIPKIFSPPFEHQIFGELNPTPKGEIFLRKIFEGYDLKSEDEKEFFRLAEIVRSLTAMLSDRKN